MMGRRGRSYITFRFLIIHTVVKSLTFQDMLPFNSFDINYSCTFPLTCFYFNNISFEILYVNPIKVFVKKLPAK